MKRKDCVVCASKAQRVANEIEALFSKLGYARVYWKWRISAAQSGDPGARKECDEAGIAWAPSS